MRTDKPCLFEPWAPMAGPGAIGAGGDARKGCFYEAGARAHPWWGFRILDALHAAASEVHK